MLKKMLSGAAVALTLGGALLTTATPAAAQQWHGGNRGVVTRGYDHRDYGRHNNGGAILGAGILGLVVGAALASDHDRYAPAPAYYGDGYGYAPAYGNGCTTYTQWDPRFRRYVEVNRCY
jgi:hypothetical protein